MEMNKNLGKVHHIQRKECWVKIEEVIILRKYDQKMKNLQEMENHISEQNALFEIVSEDEEVLNIEDVIVKHL